MDGTKAYCVAGRIASLVTVAGICFSAVAGPLGTGFTYQGRIERDGAALDGVTVQLQFELWTDPNGGSQVGNASFATTMVVDGVFSTTVNAADEFGPLAFIGEERWLQISVRESPQDPFSALTPRQELSASPQALFALAGGAGVGTGNALDAADGSPTNAVWVDNDGQVGIGTTTPQRQLDVAGSIRSFGTGSTGVSVFNPNDGGDSVSLGWQNDVARIRVSGSGGSTGFDIQRNGDVSLLRLLDGGNMGVREPNPQARLHVTVEPQGLLSSALENDDIIVEAQDAAIGLYSSDQGVWGSALAFKEIDSGAIVDTWGIARRTSPSGSGLFFTYGPSDNYATNPATMAFDDAGNVGIGIDFPTARLDVAGAGRIAGNLTLSDPNGVSTVFLDRSTGSTGGGAVWLRAEDGIQTVEIEASEGVGGGAYINMWNSAGGQTVRIDADNNDDSLILLSDAAGTPSIELHSDGYSSAARFSMFDGTGAVRNFEVGADESGGGSIVVMRNSLGNNTVEIDADESDGSALYMSNSANIDTIIMDADESDAANVFFRDELGQNVIELDALEGGRALIRMRNHSNQEVIVLDTEGAGGRGRVITQELEITGGADLSEQFDIHSAAADGVAVDAEAGMVVCIDPVNPGKLVVSSSAYDPTVAGVVSGAGGVRPGMLMGQRSSAADGAHPVALTGRVYVHCDASHGAIRPGDLLTTSATPGHAMKVSDPQRAHGAVLGKAMSSLDAGRGLVLVLVSLQ